MKAENAKKQADLLMQIIDKISSVHTELFENCMKETKGKSTSESNIYFESEYEETQELLYNVMSKLAQRNYELNNIKD